MPVRFHYRKLKLSDLSLDPQNPRFVAQDLKDEPAIIEYLLKNEDVVGLAIAIASYGGLMPGEFPLVCEENGAYMVVEGNRRICSCKLLLNPILAPVEFRASIPQITKATREEIKRISVHIINSRAEAQIVLATRHIQGVKRWPSIAKFMFFANHYEANNSLDQIKLITGINQDTVKKSLKKHYFLKYILSLDCWTDIEKQNMINYSGFHQKGVDKFLRIFTTEGNSILQLSYDEYHKPVSALPEFGKIVEYVVRNVFELVPTATQISTRTTFSQIKDDVKEWLPSLPKSEQTTEDEGAVKDKPKPSRQTEFYLENLVYNIVPTTKEDRALVSICDEIKRISKGGAYRQYPLAACCLTRAILEQALKRFLMINDNATHRRLCPSDGDSSLSTIMKHFCNSPALFTNRHYHRLFVGLFPNGKGIKDLMDLNMHQPAMSMPTGVLLETWVSAGLKNMLEYLLK